jgi:hypothetical protein
MNDTSVEWRVIIKFFIKANESVSEISDKLRQVYGDESCVSKWAKGFWKGEGTCNMMHGWGTHQLPIQMQHQKGESVKPI